MWDVRKELPLLELPANLSVRNSGGSDVFSFCRIREVRRRTQI